MSQSQLSRIEEFLFRAMWLILRGMAKSGRIDHVDVDEWQRDYINAGGGTITPRPRT